MFATREELKPAKSEPGCVLNDNYFGIGSARIRTSLCCLRSHLARRMRGLQVPLAERTAGCQRVNDSSKNGTLRVRTDFHVHHPTSSSAKICECWRFLIQLAPDKSRAYVYVAKSSTNDERCTSVFLIALDWFFF
jgi:hypothetical protein